MTFTTEWTVINFVFQTTNQIPSSHLLKYEGWFFYSFPNPFWIIIIPNKLAGVSSYIQQSTRVFFMAQMGIHIVTEIEQCETRLLFMIYWEYHENITNILPGHG